VTVQVRDVVELRLLKPWFWFNTINKCRFIYKL